MDTIHSFILSHKAYFDVAQALGSVVNLVTWCAAAVVLVVAMRRSRIHSLSFGPVNVRMQQEAVEATASAARAWLASGPSKELDVSRIRRTVEEAFSSETADNLIGKSVLWVDDNPANNYLAVRALRKYQLEVEQVTSTEAALEAMQGRRYDLVISDMGRGDDLRAGYKLLQALREQGNAVPFFIFSSEDKPEFRREASERGAQLSTNDMIELVDCVVRLLGAKS